MTICDSFRERVGQDGMSLGQYGEEWSVFFSREGLRPYKWSTTLSEGVRYGVVLLCNYCELIGVVMSSSEGKCAFFPPVMSGEVWILMRTSRSGGKC